MATDQQLPDSTTAVAGGHSVRRMVRLIVCAALRQNGEIICGPRHFDERMRERIAKSQIYWKNAEQGFVDNRGQFLTREEAWEAANAAGQIRRRCGGDSGRLFSENLY